MLSKGTSVLKRDRKRRCCPTAERTSAPPSAGLSSAHTARLGTATLTFLGFSFRVALFTSRPAHLHGVFLLAMYTSTDYITSTKGHSQVGPASLCVHPITYLNWPFVRSTHVRWSLLYSNRWPITLIVCEFCWFNSEGDLMSPVSKLMEREASHCSFRMLPKPRSEMRAAPTSDSFPALHQSLSLEQFSWLLLQFDKEHSSLQLPTHPPYTHPGWQISCVVQIMTVTDNGSEEIKQASGYFVCLFVCCFRIYGDFHLDRLVAEVVMSWIT